LRLRKKRSGGTWEREEIPLVDALQLEAIAVYGQRATSAKYLINKALLTS
jgi:hypothetical protein